MLTQFLQISEFFHNDYIFDIRNSTTPEIVKRSAWYRARLVQEWGPLRDQTPNKIIQQRIRPIN